VSILDLLGRGARGVGRAVGDMLPYEARFWPGDLMQGAREVPYVTSSTMGALSAGLSGGDGEDVLRGAGYGLAGGVGMRAAGALPGAMKLAALPSIGLPALGGALAVRGDVDAAARKLLAFANNDPNRLEAASEILYGERQPYEEELGEPGYRGRRDNIYGIAGADEMGTSISGTERQAALQRAFEMLAERGRSNGLSTPQQQGTM
jgi:hypothetical protein